MPMLVRHEFLVDGVGIEMVRSEMRCVFDVGVENSVVGVFD